MKLKELRESKNLTQRQVAKDLGFVSQTYNRYELETSEPNIETLKKIAKYFNVSLDELCGYDISESKREEIKKFSNVKNKCYNILVSMTDEQANLTYAYMLGLTEQEI